MYYVIINHNKVNTKTYKIDKTDEGYKVLISENAYSEIAGRVIAGHSKHSATFTVKLVEPAEPVDEPSVDNAEQEVSSAAIEEGSDIVHMENEMLGLLDDIMEIKMQLDEAKSDAAANGVFFDRKWFLSAKYTLRKKGMRHQRLLRIVADKKRSLREKKASNQDLVRERIFIRMVRDIMSKDKYLALWQAVDKEFYTN